METVIVAAAWHMVLLPQEVLALFRLVMMAVKGIVLYLILPSVWE